MNQNKKCKYSGCDITALLKEIFEPQKTLNWEEKFDEEFKYALMTDKEYYSGIIKRIKFLIPKFLLQNRKEVVEMCIKSLPKETPDFKNFGDALEWMEKNRGTDSQIYSDGFDNAISEVKDKLNKLKE